MGDPFPDLEKGGRGRVRARRTWDPAPAEGGVGSSRAASPAPVRARRIKGSNSPSTNPGATMFAKTSLPPWT